MINMDWTALVVLSQLCFIFGFIDSRRYSPFGLPVIHREVHRTWSEWSAWSTCTRTCGGGVKVRTRTCRVIRIYHPLSSIPKPCVGNTTEYALCRKQNCPSHSEDFLTYQCSLHDRQMIGNRLVQEWIPHNSNKNSCELQCISKDNEFWFSFGKVIDGTPCTSQHSDTRAICVNGRCTEIDCADQLGTDNKADKCGVCRGDNSTCAHFRSSFWSRQRNTQRQGIIDFHYDYDQITEIPKRAMHVSVWETSSSNFLALMDEEGKILINGNWQIGLPEIILDDDSKIKYNRSINGYEIISIRGPTSSEFLILVLGQGTIPTVDVEYWLPKNKTRPRSQLAKQFKSTYSFENHIWKNKTGKNLKNIKYTVTNAQQYRTGKPIPRTRGYKSFYQRNKIFQKEPLYGQYFPKPHSKLAPTILATRTTSRTSAAPRTFSTTRRSLIFDDKHRYHYHGKYVNLHKDDSKSDEQKLRGKQYWSRPTNTSSLTRHLPKTMIFAEARNKTMNRNKLSKRWPHPSSDTAPKAEELVSSSKLERKKQKFTRKKRRQKENEVSCPPCVKVKEENKHFCFSDFVLRVTVQSLESQNDQRRYEVDVIQSYKNKIAILSKEYLWTPNLCKCPKLRLGQEYIVMGYLKAVKRESQLIVDKDSFVRKYNRKRARKMQRFLKNQNTKCKYFLETLK